MRRFVLAALLLSGMAGLSGCGNPPPPSPMGPTHFQRRLPGVDKPPAGSTAAGAKETKP
jgi:hypothetical protein